MCETRCEGGVKSLLQKRKSSHACSSSKQNQTISLKSKSAKKEYFPVLIINHKATNKFTE